MPVLLFAGESEFENTLHFKIADTIKNAKDIPGFKSEELPALSEEMLNIWNVLTQEGYLEVMDKDSSVRPYFVTLQGIIEHVLASEIQDTINDLKGVIHTPRPTTPLCTKGEISEELVHPTIAIDPACLLSVKARTTLLRDYLFKGADLYVVYPKDGINNRTEVQQEIYNQELLNHPDHLFDIRLDCESLPSELVGATYTFKDQGGERYAFAIKITQAKDPQDFGKCALWFGPISNPEIQSRVGAVSTYLESHNLNLLSN